MSRSCRTLWHNWQLAWNRSLPRKCRTLLGATLVAAGPAYVAPSHAPTNPAATIAEIVRRAIAKYDLRAVIVRVTIDGKVVPAQAFGEPAVGELADTDRRRRDGSVAA